MKKHRLIHKITKHVLEIGDMVTITADCKIKGSVIMVQDIEPPTSAHPLGRIIYDHVGTTWQQIIPDIADYEWDTVEEYEWGENELKKHLAK